MSAGTRIQHHVADSSPGLTGGAFQRRQRRLAWVVTLLFLLLGIAYSLATPPFEAPDEPFHYAFARHIAQGNGLPVQSAESTGPWEQEGSQAPLYYLLTGALTSWIDQSDFAQIAMRNPRANIGNPLEPGNKNFVLYSGNQPKLQGANLALHLGRWFSLLLGVVTLWCIFLTAEFIAVARFGQGQPPDREPAAPAMPRRHRERYLVGLPYLPLLAMAMVAAIPQFGFISAAFTNDNLITAIAAAAIFWMAHLLVRPLHSPIRLWEWFILGLLLGLAALSKLQGLGLAPLAALVIVLLAYRRRSWRLLFGAGAVVAATLLAVAGWWYVRNLALYGDWSGLGHLTTINGRRTETLTLARFWPEFRGLRFSVWGLFGWFNILLPDWFYTFTDILTVMALVGLPGAVVYLARSAGRPQVDDPALRTLTLVGLWALVSLGLLTYWIVQATGSQGRLLFPGLIAFGILLVLGIDFWLAWLPDGGRLAGWAIILLALAGISLYTVTVLLPGAYNAPAPIAELPPTATPVSLTFGDSDAIRLVGIDVGKDRYRLGERVPVTLYLQSEHPLQQDYQLFIQLLDEQGREVANLTSHPGWGRNPTTQWQPGVLYADRYVVQVTQPLAPNSPLQARVYAGFIDPATAEATNLPLPAYDATGAAVTAIIGSVVLEPDPASVPQASGMEPLGSVFGGVMKAVASSAPRSISPGADTVITATVLWEAVGQPATGYTGYVHLLDGGGQQQAGFDRAPAGDRFPTDAWRTGDRVLSDFPLHLPEGIAPGRYELWLGLYESASGGEVALPISEAAAVPSKDHQIRIGMLEITP
ncbi:MAG: hypothetical protein IPK16_21585 [Anaerolineales bacterium]|nr:hypothetical protein [Anaerolineales bacterium]